MFGALFQPGGQTQGFVGRKIGLQRQDVGDDRFTPGQGAGFIDSKNPYLFSTFQRLGIFDEDAVTRPLPGTNHDRRRRGQTQRTGTGNHQHGHGIDQRNAEHATKEPPTAESQQRDQADHRHKNRRNAVGQALHRRFGALRLRHQTNDPGKQGMFPHAGRTAAQHAFAVAGCGEHAVTGLLGDGQALAGEHRLIDAGQPLDHLAIDRQAFTRADDENIAGNQQRGIEFDKLPVALDPCGFRLQAQEAFDRRRGTRLGTRFELFAEQHQRNHRCRRFKIHRQFVNPAQGHDQAEEVGGAGTERHQHVHIRPATLQRFPATLIKASANPELNRRRQHELQPARQQILMSVAGEIQPVEHGHHLRHQREGQRGGDPETLQLSLVKRQLACFFLFP